MHKFNQAFANVAAANATLLARMKQSSERVEAADRDARQYADDVQAAYGQMAASEAYSDLVRRIADHYATFAEEHAQDLAELAAAGQRLQDAHGQATAERVAENGRSTVLAFARAPDGKPRAKGK